MKITICNSTRFHEKAVETKKELEKLGHEALTHPMEVEFRGEKKPVIEQYNARQTEWDEEIENLKSSLMKDHFDKIKESDAILVLNLDKDDKKNYVGGNTLLEMGVAFALNKKIFMLNSVPEGLSYVEEIKGMKPTILNGELGGIK